MVQLGLEYLRSLVRNGNTQHYQNRVPSVTYCWPPSAVLSDFIFYVARGGDVSLIDWLPAISIGQKASFRFQTLMIWS